MTASEDLDDLKRHLQGCLGNGLTLVIGSGLSCAEGLPGMGELADHLRRDVPLHHRPQDETGWREIAGLIGSIGLEPALLRAPPGAELEAVIVDSTARLIAAAETRTIAEVFAGTRRLRLTKLVPHLMKPDTGIPIVTTNYDRLVEVAVEEAGLGVDCMFTGDFAGRVDEEGARLSHCREVRQLRRRVQLVLAHRAVVSKPHGSLDWYARAGEPVRYAGELPGVPRLIVPPGRNKFRTGYDRPFDRQRERANRAIDEAARLLILGYGFADEHLETHLRPALAGGKPALVLTWAMTDAVRGFVLACPAVTAIERVDDATIRVFQAGAAREIAAPPIWDLNAFINEVLEP
ncbi:SIR2 family protein [Sphingomonas sp. PsM26]|jgi:hypothetical protein|nr:SIR2 family protein [Sphingomonas sp. PsM26]